MHQIFRGRAQWAAALCATCASFFTMPAHACSTCKCGDYTITLLGTEQSYAGRFRLGVEGLSREERQGSREIDEERLSLALTYSASPEWTFAAQVPFVRKTLHDANLARQRAEGVGDIDVFARWSLWRQGEPVLRHAAGVRIGVRLPTTEQVRDGAGERLDIDVQPDAGATAPNLGGWYAYYRFPWFLSAAANYFRFGEGHQGFDPGNAWTGSLLGQYAVTPTLALQLGLDGRDAQENRYSGVPDPNSGGALAMTFVGAALRFHEDLVMNLGVQLPVVDKLRGAQDEGRALRFNLVYDL